MLPGCVRRILTPGTTRAVLAKAVDELGLCQLPTSVQQGTQGRARLRRQRIKSTGTSERSRKAVASAATALGWVH